MILSYYINYHVRPHINSLNYNIYFHKINLHNIFIIYFLNLMIKFNIIIIHMKNNYYYKYKINIMNNKIIKKILKKI